MNVLQVSMRDLVGKRFNGYQLHHSLRARGHDAHMLVLDKQSMDASVHAHPRWTRWLERGLYAAERVTSLQGLLSPIALSFPRRECFRRAEVVHWHLVYPHYVSVPLMPHIARMRPTVWTLHDPWPMTGHCIHPAECERWRTGCGRCPDLKRNFTMFFDTTAPLWRIKRSAYRRAAPTLIVASEWMKRHVAASPLLSHLPCHLIPFGLDLATWRPADRAASRARLGIPADARVIAFRMPSGEKQRKAKGVPWLLAALERLELSGPTCLLVFEEKGQLAPLAGRFDIKELGWLDDDARVVEAMSAADVFLMPSLAESFGLMALEAMACGTPAIVSAGTALADAVRAPRAGLAVRTSDAGEFARAITDLLGDDSRRRAMGAEARRIVAAEHSYDLYVDRHLALYQDLAPVASRTGSPRTR